MTKDHNQRITTLQFELNYACCLCLKHATYDVLTLRLCVDQQATLSLLYRSLHLITLCLSSWHTPSLGTDWEAEAEAE